MLEKVFPILVVLVQFNYFYTEHFNQVRIYSDVRREFGLSFYLFFLH